MKAGILLVACLVFTSPVYGKYETEANDLSAAAINETWCAAKTPTSRFRVDERFKDLQYFAISKAQNIMKQEHLFVFSGNCTVNPILTCAGFQKIFAPPYCASSFKAELTLFNKTAVPIDYTWYPSEFYADYGKIQNVNIESTLVPVAGKNAVIFAVKFDNNEPNSRNIPIKLNVSGSASKLASKEWAFPQPNNSESAKRFVKEDNLYLDSNGTVLSIGWNIKQWTGPDVNTISGIISVEANKSRIIYIVAAMGDINEAGRSSADILADIDKYVTGARENWCDRIRTMKENVPELITDNSDLKMFYDRSLYTIQACKWNSPGFASNPWYAEAGMDGGAVCTYIWGVAYIDKMMSVMDSKSLRHYILLFINGDMLKYYAVTPLDGSGIGPYYSYNNYSLSSILSSYVVTTGDYAFLKQHINGSTILEEVSRICLFGDDLSKPPVLIDYGTNSNLLELRRTKDYQYYVPSPNAERCMIYEQMDKMYKLAEITPPTDFANRAQQLKAVIRSSLWNSSTNWFDSLDPNKARTTAYSIQIFDMLRTGVLEKSESDGIIKHLNESEFLSKFGVHSLSKTDEGYDIRDVDWGGPGIYTGDAPELVSDLYKSGFNTQAADLLGRIIWWGKAFEYYPQAIYADKRDYRHDGRASCIAGLAAAQAVVFGVFGVDVHDDRVIINPHPLPFAGKLELKNLRVRGKCFDVTVISPTMFQVKDKGCVHNSPVGTPIEIVL